MQISIISSGPWNLLIDQQTPMVRSEPWNSFIVQQTSTVAIWPGNFFIVQEIKSKIKYIDYYDNRSRKNVDAIKVQKPQSGVLPADMLHDGLLSSKAG